MRRATLLIIICLFVWCNPSFAAVSYDKEVCAVQAASQATLAVTIDVAAGHSNYVIMLLIGGGGTANGAVSGVSGHGGAWTSVSSANGATMKGTVFKNIAPSTGSAAITITWVGTTDQASGACAYSFYDADQSTGVDSPQFLGTAGALTVISVAGDMTASAQFDTFNNRALTMGDCTTTTDESSYTSTGFSDAHCNGAATTVYNWAGYGSVSVGIAANVKQVSAGGVVPHGTVTGVLP